MYSTVFQGKKIRISNAHMKRLLERFDYQRFIVDEEFAKRWGKLSSYSPRMRNNVPCILCRSFNPRVRGCVECPLTKFEKSAYPGCITVVIALVSNNSPLHTYISSVVYPARYETQAVKDLKTITKFLKSFKKEKPHG
jgi:hypothetical protein